MQGDEETVARILNSLKFRPKGMTITDISRQLNINRNSIAKYLQILLISGQVEVQALGNAKVYTVSDRIPISSMLSCSSDFIVVLDDAGCIMHVNEGYLDFTGKKKADLIGEPLEGSGLLLLDEPWVHGMIDECRGGTQTTREYQFESPAKTLYFRMKFIPTVFEGGNKGVTAIMEDVTSLKEAEEALRKSEERYRAIIEDQMDLICRFGPDGTISFANSAFCRYFHQPYEAIVGTNIYSYILKDDREAVRTAISSLSPENPVLISEHRVIFPQAGDDDWRSSKDIFWHTWTTRAIARNPGTSILEYQVVGRDVTEEKEQKGMARRYFKYMEFLAQTAMNFIDMPPGTDIYENIGEHLAILVPEALYIAVFTCDAESGGIRVRYDAGEEIRDLFTRIAGSPPAGLVVGLIDKGRKGLFSGELICMNGGLESLLARNVSRDKAKKLSKDLDVGGIYMMGLTAGPLVLGGVFFLLRHGSVIKDRYVIETYLHQAAGALKRFGADTTLLRGA